jgi:hypothetical protein
MTRLPARRRPRPAVMLDKTEDERIGAYSSLRYMLRSLGKLMLSSTSAFGDGIPPVTAHPELMMPTDS